MDKVHQTDEGISGYDPMHATTDGFDLPRLVHERPPALLLLEWTLPAVKIFINQLTWCPSDLPIIDGAYLPLPTTSSHQPSAPSDGA